MGFVDLHAHFLPALDDGAPDAATSMTMLSLLAAAGWEHVTATPHQKAAQFLPTHEAIQSAYVSTRAAAVERKLPLTFHLAAENYWDHVFFDRTRDGSFPRYDGGRAFLFEIPPPELPARLEDTLFELSVRRFLPVMAHPERYAHYYDHPDELVALAGRCALVVDLGALAGYHGARPAKVARRLVLERVAHAAASDVHSPDDVRTAVEGIAWIRKKLGPEAVTRLCDENPRRILSGELPDA